MTVLLTSHKKNIRRCFDRAAETYDAHADMQYQAGISLLHQLQLLNLSVQHIADIGAGTGALAMELARTFPKSKLICLDLAPDMLRHAMHEKNKNSFAVCGDFDSLPFKKNSLDLLFSNMTLQWSFDFHKTLVELLRCLRPGGVLAFTLFVNNTLGNCKEYLNINSFYTTSMIEKLFAELPVELLSLVTNNRYKYFQHLLDLVKFFKKTGANYLVENKKHRYMRATQRQRLQQPMLTNFTIATCIIRKVK